MSGVTAATSRLPPEAATAIAPPRGPHVAQHGTGEERGDGRDLRPFPHKPPRPSLHREALTLRSTAQAMSGVTAAMVVMDHVA